MQLGVQPQQPLRHRLTPTLGLPRWVQGRGALVLGELPRALASSTNSEGRRGDSAPSPDTSAIWPQVKQDKLWPAGSFNEEFLTQTP